MCRHYLVKDCQQAVLNVFNKMLLTGPCCWITAVRYIFHQRVYKLMNAVTIYNILHHSSSQDRAAMQFDLTIACSVVVRGDSNISMYSCSK